MPAMPLPPSSVKAGDPPISVLLFGIMLPPVYTDSGWISPLKRKA